jgi:hypothetical protein
VSFSLVSALFRLFRCWFFSLLLLLLLLHSLSGSEYQRQQPVVEIMRQELLSAQRVIADAVRSGLSVDLLAPLQRYQDRQDSRKQITTAGQDGPVDLSSFAPKVERLFVCLFVASLFSGFLPSPADMLG